MESLCIQKRNGTSSAEVTTTAPSQLLFGCFSRMLGKMMKLQNIRCLFQSSKRCLCSSWIMTWFKFREWLNDFRQTYRYHSRTSLSPGYIACCMCSTCLKQNQKKWKDRDAFGINELQFKHLQFNYAVFAITFSPFAIHWSYYFRIKIMKSIEMRWSIGLLDLLLVVE